jgi:hypothetical protein|tara:strand:+ start:135 stop:593 length:459 start_codon:yes stop_codon:yes gene_type:complete
MERTEFVTKDNVHEATNLEKIRSLMANAERLDEDELVKKCKKRIFKIAGNECETEIEKRLFQALAAYEEILREKHNKAVRANYTKRKIKNKGVIQTLTDWALDKKVTPGFEALVSQGLEDFTGEKIVIDFAEEFPVEVVEAAKIKFQSINNT